MAAKLQKQQAIRLKNKSLLWLAPAVLFSLQSTTILAATPKKEEKTTEATEPFVAVKGSGSYLSGRWARNNGDIDSALVYLKEVYAQDPNNMAVTQQLQNALLQQGEIDAAIVIAEKITATKKDDSIASLLLTLKAFKAGDYKTAISILDKESGNSSGQLWLPLLSGWADVGSKTLKKPMTLEGLSANVGRAASVVNYHLALINQSAGFTEAAAQNFKLAIEDPRNPPGRVMLALVAFYEKHQSPVLKELVENYKKSYPGEEMDTKTLGLDTVNDGAAEVLFTMGSVMLAGNLTPDAVVYFHLAQYVKPEFPLALLALGDSYSEMRQFNKANVMYSKIAQTSPLYPSAQLRRAANLDRLGNTADALAELSSIGAKWPKQPESWTVRGDILRQHARYAEAGESYTQALMRTSATAKQWPLYYARGAVLERQGKWREAEKDLQKALELNPNQPDVLNYLAYGWIDRGEHIDKASDMLKIAVEARPGDAQILDSMGWALYLQGKYKESVSYMEKAVGLMPADATVNAHLGDVYYRVGRKTEARFQWERALTFKPDIALAEALQKKIKEGLPPPKLKVADTAPAKKSL